MQTFSQPLIPIYIIKNATKMSTITFRIVWNYLTENIACISRSDEAK